MKPTKEGQIVKFHTPLPGEDENQLYVLLELKIDGQRDRADIKALGTGSPFPVINTVPLLDLEVVQVQTKDLMGHTVSIRKADNSEVRGEVTNVELENIFLDLNKSESGVETNVWMTVKDHSGATHEGTLVVR